MPRAEAGTAKAIGNAIKAKGLTKLRFYCQICQKACRDENGYKCHIESESHMRQMMVVGENAGQAIDGFSKTFQDEFVQLLSRRFGTRRIKANQVYQEYIQDRHHLHMNATKWVSLTEFVKHLGREGIVHVDETEKGWFISWVDNSPTALARQDALQKMDRQRMDDEQRQRKFLAEQIERAKKEAEAQGQGSSQAPQEIGLKRDEGPVKIGISLKPKSPPGSEGAGESSATSAATASGSTSSSAAPAPAAKPVKLGGNIFKMSKAPASSTPPMGNALKAASSASKVPTASGGSNGPNAKKPPSSLTAAERIMMEEQERKRKKESMGPQPSAKRLRM